MIKKISRQAEYSYELAGDICFAIATSPECLTELCKQNAHWPDTEAVLKWLSANHEIVELYRNAKILHKKYFKKSFSQ